MHRRIHLALGAGAFIAGVVTMAAPVGAGSTDTSSSNRTTIAVIGDVPYGAAQEASFGDLVGAINVDPKVRVVMHVGDTKNGSTPCTDERLTAVRDAFESFEDPVVYTPGDNEWTDCHRPLAGSYNPLERLAEVRELYFSEPGSTLGRRPMNVTSQPELVENVRWMESQVAFATVHVVGSNNGLALWTGQTQVTPEQLAEVESRIAAAVEWIDETFDAAEANGARGVVIAMQADTFQPAPESGHDEVIDGLEARAAAFDGDVLLLQGDSHVFTVDHPLPVDSLTRIVVHGETLPFEYLRLTVDPQAEELFTWEQVILST
jgi:Calcineurin-like phosphoesterase